MDSFVYSIGGNPEDMSADNFILSVENQMGKAMISSESILFAVVFVLMFVLCGYLLIYNIFDISVMQDVRQYGLLRMIGTSTRQIKSIVNRQAVWLTLIGLPIGLIAGFFAGRALLPVVMRIFSYEYSTGKFAGIGISYAICYSRIVYDFDSVYQYPQTGQKGIKSISHGGNSLYGAG